MTGPGYGKGFWLEPLPGSGFEGATALGWELAQADGTEGDFEAYTIYVEFVGELSTEAEGEVGYGHMGLYRREIKVTRLYVVAEFEAGQCR